MARPKVLALIMAGGKGSRMNVLTQVRAKPALPFAGVYRLIDFPLSNCVHSGISDVWVIEQFQPHGLNDHLANGRPWDLDRTYGGLRILQPYTGTSESGWHEGNADAIYRNKRAIAALAPDLILVLSADHIYKLDYGLVIDAHLQHDADVTMVTTRVPIEEAGRFGAVHVDQQGRVTKFEYKPEDPTSPIVTTEVFVYNAQRLLEILEELAAQGEQNGDEEPPLQDFGDELLPRLVEAGQAYAFPLEGYWRDVGIIESYWQAHIDLLSAEPALNLDEAAWPILTYGNQRMPARIHSSAKIENSLISPGCDVRGHVLDSVLAPGVVVGDDAIVWRSIILQNTHIESHAQIGGAILDTDVHIGTNARIGQEQAQETPASRQEPPEITVIGRGARIDAGAHIPPGEHVKPAGEDV